ncbi:MAG TPA: phosphotransferase [Candidatus Saccharimonadales bacterium]|nr:phosphotransferase [Candidatus Saccharimonadales bacterium]
MHTSDVTTKFEMVVRRIHPKATLLKASKLEGGVSAQVTALEIELPGGEQRKVVVRQYGEANLLSDPSVASHEFSLLKILRSHDLPVPEPLYADESNEILPSPYLVVSFIDGKAVDEPSNITDFVKQMADILARIHAARVSEELAFLPDQTKVFTNQLQKRPQKLDETLSESRIRDVLASAWPPTQTNDSVLLHGDFWPGNSIWKHNKLAGIIDWEDAGYGDPLADLGNGRLEILMFFGPEASETFTNHYQSLMPALDYGNLPYWDLCAALRPAGKMAEWGLDGETLQKFQNGHRHFVDQAIEKLAV